MRKNYLVICFLCLIYACGEKKNPSDTTYFAGEIVNPTAPHVVLLKGDVPVDTAYLDEKNRFEFRFESIEDGLYNFNHHPEFQYVFLQQGDSMQIRLNTVAFDESLVFSGNGEHVNNFMIDLYLKGEGEEEILRKEFMRLEPEQFSRKLDSLSKRKMQELETIQEEGDLSSMAYDMARASIQYKNYYYKEGYPFWHKKQSGDRILHDLPEDFYAYRKEVSYQDPNLTFLKPYYDFMIFHIGNLAYMGCRKKCAGKTEEVREQLHFNRHQLQLIDSLIPEQELKDNLFRTVAFNYLLKHDTQGNFRTFMEDFHRRSANNRHLDEIKNLHSNIQKLRPGHSLPMLPLLDMDGEERILSNIPMGNDRTVLYFWSGPQQQHLENITQRVRELKASDRYRDYKFVGICLRTDPGRWKELVAQYRLDPDNQYWAEDFDAFAHTLIVYHPFKSIVVENGKILDGFASLNTSFAQ